MNFSGIISSQQANYQKVDPEFKNESVYSEWAGKKTSMKNSENKIDMVDQYFQEKYFSDKNKSLTEQFKPFSTIKNTDSTKNPNAVLGVLYDFKFLILGTFVLFNLASFGSVLYTFNKEKARIDDMNKVREGKGVIAKLTPFNPT